MKNSECQELLDSIMKVTWDLITFRSKLEEFYSSSDVEEADYVYLCYLERELKEVQLKFSMHKVGLEMKMGVNDEKK